MSQDNDKKNSKDGGFGSVFLIIVILVAMAFVGTGDQPLDRLADLIMICVWVMSIGLLILGLFFIIAYSMQTAMTDLYESLLEDLENSRFKEKVEHYRVLFDKKVLGRTYKPALKNKLKAQGSAALDSGDTPKPTRPAPKKKPRRKTKEDSEKELQKQLEDDLIAMLDEEQNNKRR